MLGSAGGPASKEAFQAHGDWFKQAGVKRSNGPMAKMPLTAQKVMRRPCPPGGIRTWEVALRSQFPVTVTLYDRYGTPMVLKVDGVLQTDPTVEIPGSTGACSAVIDFDSSPFLPAGIRVISYDNETARFFTMEFGAAARPSGPSGSFSSNQFLVFSGAGHAAGTCASLNGSTTNSFLCPNGSTSSGQGDFFVQVNPGGQLDVSPNYMWFNGGTTSHYISETISGNDWVWPYHAPVVCAGGRCEVSGDAAALASNYLIMPVDGVLDVRQPLTKRISAQITLPANGIYDWTESDLALEFGPAASLDIVSHNFSSTGTTFTAAAQGWGGLRVEAGGSATLTNSVVEKAGTATIAAITVTGGAFTLTGDQSRIRNSPGNGIYATGSTASVVIDNGSRVQNNAGAGLFAANGAQAYLQGGAVLSANGRGIRSNGPGTDVEVDRATVTDNTGNTGLHSDYYGRISLRNLYGPVTVQRNGGGLYSETAGLVDAMAWSCTMDPTFCTPAPTQNRLLNNSPGPYVFDAFTMDAGAVYAERNYWGDDVTSSADLNLLEDGWGTLTVDPVRLTDPAPGGSLRQGDGTLPLNNSGDIRLGPVGAYASEVGRPGSVAGVVESAQRATAWGDDALAAFHLEAALDLASTDSETRTAWGATGRILGTTPVGPETKDRTNADGEFGARVASHLAARLRAALEDGTERPWALRALAAGFVARGERAEAARMADALVAEADRFAPIPPSAAKVPEGAGRRVPLSHAAFGHALRVRLAVEAGDVAGARAALAVLVRTDARAAADAVFAVAAAFPEEDVADAADAARALAQGRSAVGAAAAARTADADGARLAVVPNPAGRMSGERARVAFEMAEAGLVSVMVFDALGRQVAVVAEGLHAAGPHTVALPLADLPAGVYVLRMVTAGHPEQIVRRFSVAR